ncbi:MAG TPA: SUMF1/EgtB/PvdO family nonheme iron enzyme [Candidatus Thiothrix moscowensis]|uniref:SUMF1/EgtB/PvdO family nonheme iron enzyme n=1 Tax=unclassified Thiothrix TaxID=2636184 RepID=UPI0025FFA4A2|nr:MULTISPECIES: SUMF1/EgtB/PvdO family nonheme iron enzyme [unclassified Thiothrix]HRJ53899.1 SUMF1/EgtB/PvdO family nonheme iron enzyme [Candidatus Thiothrix moscowensis]HRJ93981.1 SUMF1/EgtB/PvdO family nonheme iron enzyme [Candidatus Thiothrix moscowensis]
MSKTYLNFDVLLNQAGDSYQVHVIDSPAGQASRPFTLPFSALELENFILKIGQNRGNVRSLHIETVDVPSIKKLGGALYETLFSGVVAERFRSSLAIARREGKGLRIRLRLSGAPKLIDIPWELLFDADNNNYVGLSVNTPIIRKLDLATQPEMRQAQGALQVLVMISSPSNYPQLNVEREWERIHTATLELQRAGRLVLTRVEPSLAALQRQLRREDYHVFHYIGHGGFDRANNDGVLVLEDRNQKSHLVSGQYLGTILYDETTLQLVLLNSCSGGRTSVTDPFAGVGQSLLQKGIPAVIAMQFEITDDAAITFSHEFYAALVDGYPIDAAVAEARKMIYAEANQLEWATPVLYTSIDSGSLLREPSTEELELLEKQRQQREEDKRQVELKRQQEEEAKRQAELKRQQEEEEAKRQAELKHQQEEEARQIELKRQQEEEIKRQAELKRQQEEEAARQAELKRREAELQRHQQLLKQQEETLQQLKQQQEKLKRQEEETKQRAELEQQEKSKRREASLSQLNSTTKPSVPPQKPVWANAVGNDQYGYYADLVVKGVTQRFRWIGLGIFWMGSPESEPERFDFEVRHQVTLTKGFWLADTACTQAFWQAVKAEEILKGGWWKRTFATTANPSRANPSRFKDDNNPVESVDWNEVKEFIAALNKIVPGLNTRLPTEAEWEYACRAGTTTPFSFGDNITPEQVNYDGNKPYANGAKGLYRGKTVPVKSLPPNPWGLYEMHGNVWEWCQDVWQDKLPAEPVTDPEGAGVGDAYRVVRGGSWNRGGRNVRSAIRGGFDPADRSGDLGFRFALGH